MNKLKQSFQRFALAAISCTLGSEVASGQDLCTTGQVFFTKSEGRLTVNFADYFPIKLVTPDDCNVSGNCSYDVAIVSGNEVDTHFEGLEISDLCFTAFERRGEFERHSVSEYSPLLNDVFEFSRNTTIVIETASGDLAISRTDFAPHSDDVGWLNPLLENGGTLLIAEPAASTYSVVISVE